MHVITAIVLVFYYSLESNKREAFVFWKIQISFCFNISMSIFINDLVIIHSIIFHLFTQFISSWLFLKPDALQFNLRLFTETYISEYLRMHNRIFEKRILSDFYFHTGITEWCIHSPWLYLASNLENLHECLYFALALIDMYKYGEYMFNILRPGLSWTIFNFPRNNMTHLQLFESYLLISKNYLWSTI